jgi:FtsP/CotA-like multicopper oxidase with cupredoxin domain
MRTKALTVALAFGLVACGGDDAPSSQPAPGAAPGAAPAAPAGPGGLTMPDWIQADHAARTVSIELTAGSTSANNHWNFNGFYGGTGGVTVPEGYTITVTLVNQDPAMAHSVGVGERQASYPNQFPSVTPVFEGAVTSNPTSMTESTLPGETESITFVADATGDFALICYVTGHAATGMWMPFTVATGDAVGVTP